MEGRRTDPGRGVEVHNVMPTKYLLILLLSRTVHGEGGGWAMGPVVGTISDQCQGGWMDSPGSRDPSLHGEGVAVLSNFSHIHICTYYKDLLSITRQQFNQTGRVGVEHALDIQRLIKEKLIKSVSHSPLTWYPSSRRIACTTAVAIRCWIRGMRWPSTLARLIRSCRVNMRQPSAPNHLFLLRPDPFVWYRGITASPWAKLSLPTTSIELVTSGT